MVRRPLGQTGLSLSPIGFGAFKIGRNQGVKYVERYELPIEDEVERLLNGILDLGVNYIDTAPAYGLSEERIGKAIAHRNHEFIVSTKVGETFENGKSKYDFSAKAVRESVARSCKRLRRDILDIVFIHSDGRDLEILEKTDVVRTLTDLRDTGQIRAIGFSGKTVEGAQAALAWADAIMVEYHLDDRSHESVINQATHSKVGVVVKKGLASGRLDAARGVRFVLENSNVASIVIGGLNLNHVRANINIAKSI